MSAAAAAAKSLQSCLTLCDPINCGAGQKNRKNSSHLKYHPLERSLEKAVATHSSTLAWKIPWMEEPGGLQSMGSQRVGHD